MLHVTGQCRLTRDPELSYLRSGTAMCKFGIVSNRGYGDKQEACFYDVTAWGKTGEKLGEHVRKGDGISISGELRQEHWEAKDGTQKSKHTIHLNTWEFCLSNKKHEAAEPTQPAASVPDDDDIPF